MNHWWRQVLCVCLALTLAGCGGGGGSKKPPAPQVPPAVVKQWQVAALADAAVALIPGGGYGLDTPNALEADWLGHDPVANLLDFRRAAYTSGTWQRMESSSMPGLPTGLTYAPYQMARAGEWSILVSRLGQTLYARFDGPNGESSGYVPVSANSNSGGWAVVDASGVARLYWTEATGPNTLVTRTGRFIGVDWEDGGTETDMSLYLNAVAAGPDGKGWLFYESVSGAGLVEHYGRHVDAINGLGVAHRLDDPTFGSAFSLRKASAQNTTAITTLALQAGPAGPCLAVRSLTGASWSGVECVNVQGTPFDVSGTYEIATESGGYAVVSWSDANGRLYANVRRPDGSWRGARLLASTNGLSSIHPQVDSSGSAIVVYRTSSAGTPVRLNAVQFDASAGSWGTPERIDPTDAVSDIRVAVTYNSRGEPGVLSFSSAAKEAHVSVKINGAWTTKATTADFPTSPTFPYGNVSIQRLVPWGDGGWAALWETNSAMGSGLRQLLVATYQ